MGSKKRSTDFSKRESVTCALAVKRSTMTAIGQQLVSNFNSKLVLGSQGA